MRGVRMLLEITKPEQVIELPIDAIAGFAPEQMTALAPEAKLGIGDVVPEFDEFPLEVKLAIVPEEAMLLGGVGDFDALATVVSGPPLTDAELADLGFPVLEAEGAENDVDIALSADEIEYLETFAANNALAAMENLFDTSESVEKANDAKVVKKELKKAVKKTKEEADKAAAAKVDAEALVAKAKAEADELAAKEATLQAEFDAAEEKEKQVILEKLELAQAASDKAIADSGDAAAALIDAETAAQDLSLIHI